MSGVPHSYKDQISEYLCQNMFDGCGEGMTTMHTHILLDEVSRLMDEFISERIPGPSLPQGQRNAIIEECAKVAQPNMEPSDDRWEKGYWAAQNSISHAIRGLKHYDATGTPQEAK